MELLILVGPQEQCKDLDEQNYKKKKHHAANCGCIKMFQILADKEHNENVEPMIPVDY